MNEVMGVYLGAAITVLVVVFVILPVFVAILFDYSAKTYLEQVKLGLILAGVILGLIVFCILVIIALGFMSGDFNIINNLIMKVGI